MQSRIFPRIPSSSALSNESLFAVKTPEEKLEFELALVLSQLRDCIRDRTRCVDVQLKLESDAVELMKEIAELTKLKEVKSPTPETIKP